MARKHKLPAKPLPYITPYIELFTYLLLSFQIISTAIYYNGIMHPLIHKMLLGQTLALAAWFFYGCYCITSRQIVIRQSPYYLPLLLLCIWAGVRAATAPNHDAFRNYWIFINLVCTFPLWVTGFRHRYVRMLFIWTVVFTGMCMAAGCLRQLFLDDPKFHWDFFTAITLSGGKYERQRLGAFMGHNNESTAYLLIAGIYSLYLSIRYRKKPAVFLLGLFALISLVIIYLGGSRGVALGLIASTFVLLGAWLFIRHSSSRSRLSISLDSFNQRRLAILAIGVLAVLLVGFFALHFVDFQSKEITGVWNRFLSSPEHLISGTYPRVWLMSLLMVHDHPFLGVGFSAWPYRYPDFQKKWFTTYPDTRIGLPIIGQHTLRGHNDFLQLWAELGFIGVLLVLWLLAIHFQTLCKIVHSSRLSLVGWFAFTATIATLTRAVFAFPFHMTAASCLFIANVALVSSLVYKQDRIFIPSFINQYQSRSRWLSFAGVVILLGLFSIPNWKIMVADFSARRHGIYADYARVTTDANRKKAYWDQGYRDMQYSLKIIPNQGKYLQELGAETVLKGLYANDNHILLQAVDYLQRSKESFGFYRIHEYLGQAYRRLWENTQNPDYLTRALANYQEATAIMPTFEKGWVQQALLLAKSGKQKECLDLLSNTELRFPGFIERTMIAEAKQEPDIKDQVILYDLAASIVPTNESVFREVLLFYLKIPRMDRAIEMFTQLSIYQKQEMMLEWMKTLLFTQLENGLYQEALGMMHNLRNYKELQSFKEIWYYSGLISWIGGRHWETIAFWSQARSLGVTLDQVEPPLSVILNHALLPLYIQ